MIQKKMGVSFFGCLINTDHNKILFHIYFNDNQKFHTGPFLSMWVAFLPVTKIDYKVFGQKIQKLTIVNCAVPPP